MPTLAERIAALRLASDDSTVSDATNPTSLEVFVRIYNKCKGEGSCYTDYMEGAKLLYTYLSPIEIPHLMLSARPKLPALCDGYATQQLVKIVAGNMQAADFNYIHNLVVYYTAKHILEEVEII